MSDETPVSAETWLEEIYRPWFEALNLEDDSGGNSPPPPPPRSFPDDNG